MAGERRINWGADATDARYRTEDTGDGANFVVAEDLDGGTVLLEYDDSASEWVSRGPINMDGNAISNVSDLDVGSVSTDQIHTVNDQARTKRWAKVTLDGDQSIDSSWTKLNWVAGDDDYNEWSTDTFNPSIPTDNGPDSRLIMIVGTLTITDVDSSEFGAVGLYKNGSPGPSLNRESPDSTGTIQMPFIRINEASSSESFGIMAKCSTTGTAIVSDSIAYFIRLF